MRLLTFLFVLLAAAASAQDFSSVISKMAHELGYAHGALEQCDVPDEQIDALTYMVEELKYRAFSDPTYLVYEQFFNEHYSKGMDEAEQQFAGLASARDEAEFCSRAKTQLEETLSARERQQKTERE